MDAEFLDEIWSVARHDALRGPEAGVLHLPRIDGFKEGFVDLSPLES